MPVDQAVLRQLVEEAAGGDQETVDLLLKKYAANDQLAAKFVAGRMTHADYTRKTQELADERKKYGDQSTRLQQLEGQLAAAATEKDKIMQDLSQRRVTVAKASELMKILRDKYDLTNADLPGMDDLIETRKQGEVVDTAPDLDKKLAAFGTKLMSDMEAKFAGAMVPEIGSMAIMPVIWQRINDEHFELTGKKLSFAEQQEILKLAQSGTESSLGKGSLMGIWQDKYNIDGDTGLRMQKRDERMKADWAKEQEVANAKRLQDEALNVVTPAQKDLGAGPGISAAFKTKFKTYEMDPEKPGTPMPGGDPSIKVLPGQHVRQDTGARIPAAQRAAMKHLANQQGKVA
jgi:hypothetical protein